MTIALTNVAVRHERRIRLVFSVSLASGAFNPALYVVTPNEGSQPLVLAAYVVQNSPSVVELAFDRDLSQYATYSVAALNVGGTDGSFTSATAGAGNSAPFAIGVVVTPSNVENPDADLAALVYGEDLVWDGFDFVETDAGDLATVAGLPNLEGAIQRRVAQDRPLPWARSYGGQPGRFVNGPTPLAATVAGNSQRQAMADDRVKSATVTFGPAPGNPAATLVQLYVTPIGAATGASPIAIPLVTL